MRIEDRLSLWAAKRPREEAAALVLEGAQEIADLRRHREEDGEQMSALISGYQKMQGLCIDGKYLTDEEREAVGFFSGLPWPKKSQQIKARAATLRGLLERMRIGALPTCDTLSQNSDYPTQDKGANPENAHIKLRSQGAKVGTKLAQDAAVEWCVPLAVNTLTDEEREAIEVAAEAYASDHGERFAATLKRLLERLA